MIVIGTALTDMLEEVDPTTLLIGSIVVVGVALLTALVFRDMLHQSAMHRLAASLNFTYESPGSKERFVQRLRSVHDLFLPADDDDWFKFKLSHVMSATIDGVEVDVAEVQCYMDRFGGSDEPLHTRYPKRCTVVLVSRQGLHLPEFRSQPENRLTRWIEKEQAARSFSDFSRVVGPDAAAMEEAFTHDVTDLLAGNRAYTIIGEDAMLMLYRRETRLSARRCRKLIAFGVELIRKFRTS